MSDKFSFENLDAYKLYLSDLGLLIKQAACEAQQKSHLQLEEGDKIFQQGRVMAYVEIISLMQSQAKAFRIPLSDLRLDKFDPVKDLT